MSPGETFGAFMGMWLAAIGTLVIYRTFTGQIQLDGLLTTDGNTFSGSRLQLLILTVGGLVAYATASLTAHKLLPIQDGTVVLFAASHATYLAAKTHWAFFKRQVT